MTAIQQRDPGTDVVTAEVFRQVFRRHAAGVAVVATGGPAPVGFTATSVVSLSASPPMLSFNVSHTSSSWPAVQRAEHLALHLLAEDQTGLATTFATQGIDRFAVVPGWRRGDFDLPVLPGVMAWLAARVRAAVPAGDHAVIVAEVVRAEHWDARPLLSHGGTWATLAAPDAVVAGITSSFPS